MSLEQLFAAYRAGLRQECACCANDQQVLSQGREDLWPLTQAFFALWRLVVLRASQNVVAQVWSLRQRSTPPRYQNRAQHRQL